MRNSLVRWLVAAAIWNSTSLLAAEGSAKVLKHTSANGQTVSVVILKATELPKSELRQHVVLIDTSASQVGEHRQQALAVLESLLKALPDGDQVRLYAADLQADPLDDGFNEVHSPAVAAAVEQLKLRVPLGATNLEGVLRTAMQIAGDRPSDITYIGDGLSTADLVEVPELRVLASDLRRLRMPVHSFGVGPQKNLQVLGILAHQTGGFLAFDAIVDSPEEKVRAEKTKSARLIKEIARVNRNAAERAAEHGKLLANALKAPVCFSTEISVTPEPVPLLPPEPLPVRTDRETIYLVSGTVPNQTRIVLKDGKTGETIEFNLPGSIDQRGATFLPMMLGQLETTGGLTNPLAGMTLFHLTQSDFSDNVTAMAQRGMQALQLGDIDQAKKISALVTDAEPSNEDGVVLRKAIESFKSGKKPETGTIPSRPEKPRPTPKS